METATPNNRYSYEITPESSLLGTAAMNAIGNIEYNSNLILCEKISIGKEPILERFLTRSIRPFFTAMKFTAANVRWILNHNTKAIMTAAKYITTIGNVRDPELTTM